MPIAMMVAIEATREKVAMDLRSLSRQKGRMKMEKKTL